MKFDETRHGRASAVEGSQAIVEAWGKVSALPAGPGEWVPWMTVWIKDGVSPRAVNHEVVDRYAESFEDLPPILVQRNTFALIDGRHRLESAQRASSDFIRIVEEDVDDGALMLRAFEANTAHGLPYTLAERVTGLKAILRAYPTMSATELAKLVGVNYETVTKYRRQYMDTAKQPDATLTRTDGRVAYVQSTPTGNRPSSRETRHNDARKPLPKPAFHPTEPRTVAVDEDGYVLMDEMSRCADCGETVPEGHDCNLPETVASPMAAALLTTPAQERYFAIALRIVSDYVSIDWPAVRASATDEEYRYIRAMCAAVPV